MEMRKVETVIARNPEVLLFVSPVLMNNRVISGKTHGKLEQRYGSDLASVSEVSFGGMPLWSVAPN